MINEVQVVAGANAHEYVVNIDTDKDSAAEMSIYVYDIAATDTGLRSGDFIL